MAGWPPVAIEDQIARAKALGLRVCNLFERDDGRWRSNVRHETPNTKGEYGYEFADGITAEDALRGAIDKTKVEVLTDGIWDQ